MRTRVHTYRVEVYSNDRWILLGKIRRFGPLLPPWRGSRLGTWPGHVTREKDKA